MIYIFDLDGTLAESRGRADDAMLMALQKLTLKHTVGITSGAEFDRMNFQLPDILSRGFYVMPQSGNIVYGPNGDLLWEYKFNPEEESEAFAHIAYLKSTYPVQTLTTEEDTVEHRGSQITYNALGHSASVEEKKKFDPTGQLRASWIKSAPELRHTEARAGGNSTIDYTAIGRNKGGNITRLVERENLDREQMVYVGDRLHRGGNDETVIGLCKTISVENPKQTLELILSWL